MSQWEASDTSWPPTLFDVVHKFTSQDALGPSHLNNLHPFASASDARVNLLRELVDATTQLSTSLDSHLSLSAFDPKLLSLLRQHAGIQHSLRLSSHNAHHTVEKLREHVGTGYGDDIPLDRSAIVDWCLSKLESWGASVGMEIFREEEREGLMTVVLGGKVLVMDIEFAINRTNPLQPNIDVVSLKTSHAVPSGAGSGASGGSTSLNALLIDGLKAFLVNVQKDRNSQNCAESSRFANRFLDHLGYLMRLDQLALLEGDKGIHWFNHIDSLASTVEQFSDSEASVVASDLSLPYAPLDIFLLRSHALPLPYLETPSMSFVTHISPRAYLSLLRSSHAGNPPQSLPSRFDIHLPQLRSYLASRPRPQGITVATLSLSPSEASTTYDIAEDIASLRSSPLFPLPQAPEIESFPHPPLRDSFQESGADSLRWILDFTDSGACRGVVISQSRLREIELVVNPVSGMDTLSNVTMLPFGVRSWIDMLINPSSPTSSEKYSATFRSPTSAHPPLDLRLTSPEETGFLLEKLRVRSMRQVWAVLEIVREQCWLNELLQTCQWTTGESTDEADVDASEEELQAVLDGTFIPYKIPVNICLPMQLSEPSLFDETDIASFVSMPQSRLLTRPKLVMTCPGRNSAPGITQVSVTYDQTQSRGIKVDVTGPLTHQEISKLEEVCRRGGALGLCGKLWMTVNQHFLSSN